MSRQFELGTKLTDDEVTYLQARGRDEFIVENDRVLAEQADQAKADAAEAKKEADAKAAADLKAKATADKK